MDTHETVPAVAASEENGRPSSVMQLALRAAVFGAVAMILGGLVWLMAWGVANKRPVTSMSGFTLVGKRAPDFELPLFSGGTLSLSQLKGRPVVINFWASWCPPCREEALYIERAWRAYRHTDVMFLGLDSLDSDEAARAYLNEFAVTYPNGPDADGRITVDYGIVGMPVTFFVDREGVIERRYVGAIEEARLLTWVDELVRGVPLSGEKEIVNEMSLSEVQQARGGAAR